PDAQADFAEYAIAGLGGPIYHFWSMAGVVVRTARLVAVHNPRIAAQLLEEFPDAAITAIHLGKSPLETDGAARAQRRASLGMSDATIAFAAFGKMTADKRISAILRAIRTVLDTGRDARLLLIGDASGCPWVDDDIAANGLEGRVHMAGYVRDRDVGHWLDRADGCLCARCATAPDTPLRSLHGVR